ncbi:MAG: orotidine-5'-phosphate decarboxylase [Gemmatimonadetes bacterium]|nr:orotidine-5'-phosphate decarboxylase [Gemmatimonadota bacterium]
MTSRKVIVALDVPDRSRALALVEAIGPACDTYKVGLELFAAAGPGIVGELRERGTRVFLDLKLHDIPNQVAGAVARAGEIGAAYLTVHSLGGREMLRAAAQAAPPGLALLAVTVLTSLDSRALGELFGRDVDDVATEAGHLALIATEEGAQGVVCSAAEAGRIRQSVGPGPLVVTPGVRPTGSPLHDQRRVATAADAFAAGATHIVVGRPVTGSRDPGEAYARIAAEADARS